MLVVELRGPFASDEAALFLAGEAVVVAEPEEVVLLGRELATAARKAEDLGDLSGQALVAARAGPERAAPDIEFLRGLPGLENALVPARSAASPILVMFKGPDLPWSDRLALGKAWTIIG
ncbi:MAG: hypothetical protein QNJ30_02610 [Kiloniellales bacterium]|nr:hypothetical protein [Kiloniellales bacterium]